VLKNDKELADHVRFYFIPRDNFTQIEKKIVKIFYPFYYHKYKCWMKKAYKLALELDKNNKYSLSHQLNMIGYREPGYLWKLNLPFVWGPVGGNGNIPIQYLKVLDIEGFTKQSIRSIINFFQIRYNVRVVKAFKKTSSLLTTNFNNKNTIKKIHNIDSDVILVSPTFTSNILSKIKYSNNNFIKFVCSGNLISTKNLPLIFHSLSKIKNRNWSLDILGDGPLLEKWKNISENLGINSNITWHGKLTKKNAIISMSNCDVLLFPSLIEGSPGVVSEAISLGLPVICFDKDGQKDIVDKSCGILIPLDSPKNSIKNFSIAIQSLIDNPEVISKFSEGALKRAKQFTVDSQLPIMLKAYKKAIAKNTFKN